MDLHEFTSLVAAAIIDFEDDSGAPCIKGVNHPPTSLTDSQFLGVTTQGGQQFSIHIQETS